MLMKSLICSFFIVILALPTLSLAALEAISLTNETAIQEDEHSNTDDSARKLLTIHLNISNQELFSNLRDYLTPDRSRMSDLERMYSHSTIMHSVYIITMSHDGAFQAVSLPKAAVVSLIRNVVEGRTVSGEDDSTGEAIYDSDIDVPQQDRYPVMIYNNCPSGLDIMLFTLGENKKVGSFATIADSELYYSAVFPQIVYEQVFVGLQESPAGVNQVITESYGEDFWSVKNARQKALEEQPELFFPSYENYGLPHFAWFIIDSEDGKDELKKVFRTGFSSYSIPSSYYFSGVPIYSSCLALHTTQLFSLFRTNLKALPARQTAIDEADLESEVFKWDSIVVGAFALTDGSVQMVFYEGSK